MDTLFLAWRTAQMKTTDFAQCLASYLTMYLPGQLWLIREHSHGLPGYI